ncbi:hypothetical protein FisN_13Lh360 [Fistulifera solaris]|uniref:Uncharacterized protein n=1 Tax=Fistulifera solaris TaxID=1519565 RepID=A0A1Z5KLD9_FISSO|nr:hypothetical protein FisN_13Lh360 [Fistulifera solaris]|eukprot:GAX27096.1 hypothetical protein FisN_13Lh360 [Fistulifera solaris]
MEGFDFCCIAWKKRTGWTPLLSSVVVSSSFNHWIPRTVALQGSCLMYFENGAEDGPPRGSIDLLLQDQQIQLHIVPPSSEDDGPTPHQLHIQAVTTKEKSLKTKQENRSGSSSSGGSASSRSSNTNLSTHKRTTSHSIVWKFCFDQQSDLMTLLSQIHQVLEQGGQFASKSTERFEHDFHAADHIYRWEMIVVPPVIYPIQIHGIVLEAGRNCVVVADFGLTGYSRQQGNEFHHVDDTHSMTEAVLAAFKKLRPTQQDQRLHILTLIDPKEIRKWTKAGYDQDSFLYQAKHHSKAFETVSSWFGKMRIKKSHDQNDDSQSSYTETSYEGDHPVVRITDSAEQESSPKSHYKTKQANQILPQSDPPEIVLERAHFLLEHMNVLPPYHVFYSNSECIAVWCKTGRWSTLQTAVFLSTNSVGAAKSSTLATLGVAAANPLLAPVVALGGLIWITAPMYILKKSREQWQLITEYMTDVFWSAASAKVFVAAIQHWSGLVQKDKHGNIVAVEKDVLMLRRHRHLVRERKKVESERGQQEDESDGIDLSKVKELYQLDSDAEDMHGPLAPPPMSAPPPPPLEDEITPRKFDSNSSSADAEYMAAITGDQAMAAAVSTRTKNEMPPIESNPITTANTNGKAEDSNITVEKQMMESVPPFVDGDEPVDPPADTQETPSTDYEAKRVMIS